MARAAWAAVPFGYSVWETVYARSSGNRIGIARLSEKPFEWFSPRQDGGLLYRRSTNPQGVEVDTVSSSSARCASPRTASPTAARSIRSCTGRGSSARWAGSSG
jgi:hypothetical protein